MEVVNLNDVYYECDRPDFPYAVVEHVGGFKDSKLTICGGIRRHDVEHNIAQNDCYQLCIPDMHGPSRWCNMTSMTWGRSGASESVTPDGRRMYIYGHLN